MAHERGRRHSRSLQVAARLRQQHEVRTFPGLHDRHVAVETGKRREPLLDPVPTQQHHRVVQEQRCPAGDRGLGETEENPERSGIVADGLCFGAHPETQQLEGQRQRAFALPPDLRYHRTHRRIVADLPAEGDAEVYVRRHDPLRAPERARGEQHAGEP